MKKKIFLSVAVMIMLACIFAISVNAVTGSTSNEFGTPTTVDGISCKQSEYGTDYKAVLQNTDGTFTTYPAYYIYNGSSGSNMRLSFDTLNSLTGESYTSASLIRIEVYPKAKLNWTFQNCTSLIDVKLLDGVYFHYASFIGCSSLEEIVLPQTGITQIPKQCFYGCTSLKSLNIPETVTSIGDTAFGNCNALSEIKFPQAYGDVIQQNLRKISNNISSTPVTYIVPKSCTGIYSRYTIINCNVKEIIFTGDENSTFISDVTTDYSDALKLITYKNHCDVYYGGEHNDDDNNPCYLSSCDRCGASNQYCGNENTHSLQSVISYDDYTKFGTRTESCSNENCEHVNVVVDTQISPIFTYIGYASSYNTGKICVGYSVNQKALNEYGSDKLSYGVVAYTPKADETNLEPVVVKDGVAQGIDGSIAVELSSSYSSFDFIISGFETDEHYNKELIMCMYICEGTDVDYVCSVNGEASQMEFANTVVFADYITE